MNVYIPHCKCQSKLLSSPWFSAVYAVAIVPRNIFLLPTEKISESNHWKRALEVTKLDIRKNKKVYHFPETWFFGFL